MVTPLKKPFFGTMISLQQLPYQFPLNDTFLLKDRNLKQAVVVQCFLCN